MATSPKVEDLLPRLGTSVQVRQKGDTLTLRIGDTHERVLVYALIWLLAVYCGLFIMMSLPAIRADDIPLTKSTLRFCSYVALGILVVWHLSWRLGQEVLMLTPTTLRYWRKLGPFRRKAESEWRHISVIEAADPKKHPDAPGVHMELRTDPALEPEYAFFGRNIHNHDLPTIIAILQAYHRRSAPHRYEDETAVR